MKVKIDLKKCTGCAKCLDGCPFGAIRLINKKAVIDENKCNGCGACMNSCNKNAIYFDEE